MELLTLLLQIWPVFLGLLAMVVWLVRLEGSVAHAKELARGCQKDVDELRIKHESLDSKIVEQLAQVREALARIEGRLEAHKKGE